MKKLVILPLLLLAICMLAAVESEPSNVVGYFKMSIASNGFLGFGIPFAYADLSPNEILQGFGDEDVLQDMAEGNISYYFGEWDGDVTGIEYGKAYWLSRNAGNDDLDFYLLGTVDPQTLTIHINAGLIEGEFTAFTLNEAREVPLEDLNIIGAEDGDELYDMQNGDIAYYYSEWDGFAVNTIKPTHTYWYHSNAGEGFDWIYIPNFSTREIGSKLNNNPSK